MTDHLIGLLLGTEEDWPRAFETLLGRLGPVKDAAGTTVPVRLGIDGHLAGWPIVVFCFGLLLMTVLTARKVPGAVLITSSLMLGIYTIIDARGLNIGFGDPIGPRVFPYFIGTLTVALAAGLVTATVGAVVSLATVTVTAVAVASLPAASRATAVSVCAPFASAVVLQVAS